MLNGMESGPPSALYSAQVAELPPALGRKRDELVALLRSLKRVAVALSGGVDSAVVAKAAHLALGDRASAVTAQSPSVAGCDRRDAEAIAAQIGIRHRTIQTREFDRPAYRANDGTRCYHCKTELYEQLGKLKADLGADVIVSGANVDDLGDYRPGLAAAAEQGVRHPLQETGLTKAEVRVLACHWGLSIWNKPASPCLSSRIAPGVAATAERTARIEAAERFLRERGFKDCRVRLHEGELARVEAPPPALEWFFDKANRQAFIAALKQLGFRYVTVDLEGLRSGSLNELLSLELRTQFTPLERLAGHETAVRP
jgi:uncharacterized protein